MALAGLLDKPVTQPAEPVAVKATPSISFDVNNLWELIASGDSYCTAVKVAPPASVPPAPSLQSSWVDYMLHGDAYIQNFYPGEVRAYAPPPRSTPAQLAGLARAAAALIETRGWCQGRLRDLAGSFCTMGALRAAGASDWDMEAFNAHAVRFLAGRGDHRVTLGATSPWQSVVSWNDAPERTAAEAASLLRAVAAELDELGEPTPRRYEPPQSRGLLALAY